MVQRTQFRIVLPILQTVLAFLFGGWGLWVRNSVLSRPFFGDSTGWDSTLRFHVWPWQFKFAAILNMPAFLAGGFLSWPIDSYRPGLPEWVSGLPMLLLVPILWYWVGSWADKIVGPERSGNGELGRWILLLVFILICAGASFISECVGGPTDFVLSGIVIWLIAAIGARTSTALRRRKSKVA